ncbi:hypothetical protein [Nostoc sp.]
MTNPRPLQAREQSLIDLYSHCQLGMTPKNFYAKWDVNHEAIAPLRYLQLPFNLVTR